MLAFLQVYFNPHFLKLSLTAYQNYFAKASRVWKAVGERWIENTPSVSDLLIIKYEDVKSRSKLEMEKVVKFLGLQPDSERLTCSALNPMKRWIRKTPDNIKMRLSEIYDNMQNLSQTLDGYIFQINSSLEKRGFSTRLNYTRPSYRENEKPL